MKDINTLAGIIFKCGDEVLLGQRSYHKTLPGEWSIPSGHLKEGEGPTEASRREFYEETNIKLNGPLNIVGFINRNTKTGEKTKGLMYVFLYESDVKLIPNLGAAKDGDEHLKMDYFNLKNLPFNTKKGQLYDIIVRILSKK